jgi:hypothetical protein
MRGAAAGVSCGRGVSRRCRRGLGLCGCSSGIVSVARSGRLDSGRSVNTDSGSPGVPGAAGTVIARLTGGAAGTGGRGGVAGRIAWTTT